MNAICQVANISNKINMSAPKNRACFGSGRLNKVTFDESSNGAKAHTPRSTCFGKRRSTKNFPSSPRRNFDELLAKSAIAKTPYDSSDPDAVLRAIRLAESEWWERAGDEKVAFRHRALDRTGKPGKETPSRWKCANFCLRNKYED